MIFINMKEIIKKVLNRHSDNQLNLGSVSARDMLATEIAAVIELEIPDVVKFYNRMKAKDNPLSIEMWKGYDPNQTELEF